MKYVKGYFTGRYRGLHVDPLKMQSVHDLYAITVEPFGKIRNAKNVTEPDAVSVAKEPIVHLDRIEQADLYFDPLLFPGKRPCRETLRNCTISDAAVSNIYRKGKYTYGDIEGWLTALIPEAFSAADPLPVAPTVLRSKVNYSTSLPVAVDLPRTSINAIARRNGYGGCFPALIGMALMSIIFYWLLTHRGCNQIKPVSTGRKRSVPSTDSAAALPPLKKNNDTLMLQAGKITFSVYDWSVEDQDSIALYVNDELIADSIELNKTVHTWIKDSLPAGDNLLTIVSLNDGQFGPASPTVEITDGKNQFVFQAKVFKGKPQINHLLIRK